MDFRNEACVWCQFRSRPLQDCRICPRYERLTLASAERLDAARLCAACANRASTELEVFCRTNRFYQQDSGEDFECYKFLLLVSAA